MRISHKFRVQAKSSIISQVTNSTHATKSKTQYTERNHPTMKAQIIKEFGSPNVFINSEVALPKLGAGEVLIKVKATSVNPIDCKIRAGLVKAISPDLPAVLHGDVSGVVEEIGANVADIKKGDEVYGYSGGVKGTAGALAEYMVVDAKTIAKKPQKLSLIDSAALPLVAVTAWDALFEKANLKKGQHILIHGGVGGVGHVAIQLAKWAGATVSATVRSDNDYSVAKSLGADHVVNIQNEEVESYVAKLTDNKGFDIVFDTVGGANLENSFKAAAMLGTVVTTAARTTCDLTPLHNKSLTLSVVFVLIPLVFNTNREHIGYVLQQVAKIVDNDQLKLLINSQKFLISEVSAAHALLESGKAKGKVILYNE